MENGTSNYESPFLSKPYEPDLILIYENYEDLIYEKPTNPDL
jgi:hypothetical protein